MTQAIKELPVLKYWRSLDSWLSGMDGQTPSTGKEMEQAYKKYPSHPLLGATEIVQSRNINKGQ